MLFWEIPLIGFVGKHHFVFIFLENVIFLVQNQNKIGATIRHLERVASICQSILEGVLFIQDSFLKSLFYVKQDSQYKMELCIYFWKWYQWYAYFASYAKRFIRLRVIRVTQCLKKCVTPLRLESGSLSCCQRMFCCDGFRLASPCWT